MKTTIDIPDELYRRVKAKSALQGKRIREVTIELYRRWLGEAKGQSVAESSATWLEGWTQLGEESLRNAPPGPTATQILDADRNRSEPR